MNSPLFMKRGPTKQTKNTRAYKQEMIKMYEILGVFGLKHAYCEALR